MWTFTTGRVFTQKAFLSLHCEASYKPFLHNNPCRMVLLYLTQWFPPNCFYLHQQNTGIKRSYQPLLDTEPDRHILFTNMPGKVVLESQNLVTICFYHTVNQYTLLFLARIMWTRTHTTHGAIELHAGICHHTQSSHCQELQWVDVLHIPEVISGCGYTCTLKGRRMLRVEPCSCLTWQ